MLSPCEDGWRQWHLGSDLWVSPSFSPFGLRSKMPVGRRDMAYTDYSCDSHISLPGLCFDKTFGQCSCQSAQLWFCMGLDGWDIDICFQQGIYTISTTTVEDYAWSILWGSLCALRTQTVKGCCQCYHFSTIKNSAIKSCQASTDLADHWLNGSKKKRNSM